MKRNPDTQSEEYYMWQKRVVSLLLALVMVIGMIPVVSLSVNSATTPKTISESELIKRITSLKAIDNEYFTTTGTENPCKTTNTTEKGHGGCEFCNNGKVLEKNSWVNNLIKTRFGVEANIVNRACFPYQYFPSTTSGKFASGNGTSCYGFASFLQWYLFASDYTDKIEPSLVVSCVEYNFENLSIYARPGDIIRTSENVNSTTGHSLIYISCSPTGITLIDCNGTAAKPCKVDYSENQSYSWSKTRKYMAITRPKNSPYYGEKHPSISGYYYIVNDSEGHNVRSSQSTSTSDNIVGVLPDGEKVLITKYSSDGDWGYVAYGGFEGWTNLSSTYMKFDSVCYAECEHKYSSTSYENEHPHKEYKKCSLCGDIKYTGNTKLTSGCTSCYPPDGYLYKSLEKDDSDPNFPDKWLRDDDSTDGTVVGSVPYGEYAVVTEYNADRTWAYVKYGPSERWGWTKLVESVFPYQGTYICPVVTFNANGGNVSTTSKKVYINTPYGTLLTPTRTGYNFNGWYTAASGGTKIKETTNVTLTTNQTLYAQWSAKEYKVAFNANGGTTPTSSKTVTYASTYGTLPSPTRTGYTFNGWYTASSGGTKIIDTTNVNLTANQTLYAQWTANKYTISYNANGGTGAPSAQTKVYGTNLTLSNTKPTRSGYTFKGWSTSSNGNVAYAAGATYSANSAVTLYAVWEANSVSFSTSMQVFLNLEGIISMSVGYKFSDMDSITPEDYTDKVGLLVWKADEAPEQANATYENCSYIIEGARYNSVLGRFESTTNGIVAKELGDALCFRAYYLNDEGTYSYSKYVTNFSPKTYCYGQIKNNSDNQTIIELMASILNYGAAAQKYFKYRTDDLMNADLPEELK